MVWSESKGDLELQKKLPALAGSYKFYVIEFLELFIKLKQL